MVRFHGVFAPRAKVRPALRQLLARETKPDATSVDTEAPC
jgi:hypothetical protein